MRLRTLLLLLLSILPSIPGVAHAQTTPTEAAAIAAAQQDHTAYTLPPDELTRAIKVSNFWIYTRLAGVAWTVLSLILILELGIAARMRNVANNLSRNRWAQCFLFFLQFLLLTTLLALPLDLYQQHFALSYNLSVQTWASWFGDQAKSFLLEYLIGGLLVMLLFTLIRRFPRRWWLWFWFPVMVFTVFGVFITPYVIDPLFNHFEPLSRSNPALVQRLEQVVARGKGIDIPPDRMFLMKASEKETGLNAYVTGFGASKRVVVWDTSIQKGTTDEILFIFGHEMGHYVLGHVLSGMLFSFVVILVSFFVGFHVFQFLLRRFGQRWRIPSQDNWAALVLLILVLTVIGFFESPIDNAFSRTHEHAADVYGEEVVQGLVADPQATGQAAFQLLGQASDVSPVPSPLSQFWFGSHPPIWFRAAFAKHYNPYAPGNAPKYLPK